MSLPDPSIEGASGRTPEGLAEVGVYPTPAAGFEHGLVILAMGRPYWLMPSETSFHLLVETETAENAREQLAYFDRESAGWPPRPQTEDAPARKLELGIPLLWALVVLAVYREQIRWPGRWEELGALDPQAVFGRGEWWRLVTALFLHADLGHLLSNLFSGIFVFAAVLTTLGRQRGWLLLALASVAGNFAAAILHRHGDYSSFGASTAIFAGLGLLTGRAIRFVWRVDHPHRLRGMFIPLSAGLVLLALYGAGGPQVDVIAHLTGFGAGLACGFLATFMPKPA